MTEEVAQACIQPYSDFALGSWEVGKTIGAGQTFGKLAVSSYNRRQAQSGIENDEQVGGLGVEKCRRRNSGCGAVSTNVSEWVEVQMSWWAPKGMAAVMNGPGRVPIVIARCVPPELRWR